MSEEPAVGTRSVWDNFRDVVFEPSRTFEDVAERPRWLIPLLILSAAVLAVSFFMMPLYEAMQARALAQMPPDARAQAEAAAGIFKWVGFAISPIAIAVITAATALLFWTWGAVSGARNADYTVAFTALVYANAIVFLQSVLQAVVVAVKGAEQVAREGGPPTFGLALFMERGDLSRWVWGQIENVNFFSIWYAAVIGIAGVHALRMSRGAATAWAVAMFVIGGFLLAIQPT